MVPNTLCTSETHVQNSAPGSPFVRASPLHSSIITAEAVSAVRPLTHVCAEGSGASTASGLRRTVSCHGEFSPCLRGHAGCKRPGQGNTSFQGARSKGCRISGNGNGRVRPAKAKPSNSGNSQPSNVQLSGHGVAPALRFEAQRRSRRNSCIRRCVSFMRAQVNMLG